MFKHEQRRRTPGQKGGERGDDAAGADLGSRIPPGVWPVETGRKSVRSQRGGWRQPALLRPLLLQRPQTELVPLEALPPAEKAPIFEHVRRHGIQGPVIPLARIPGLPGHFDEAVV